MMKNAVDAFLAAIEGADIGGTDAFAPDAVLDATVPNWRFAVVGGDAVKDQLAGWYKDAGTFEELRRVPLPDGELVEFLLTWEENGVPHAAHQAHILKVDEGLIIADTVFCGGRWPASLLAEMEEAAVASG